MHTFLFYLPFLLFFVLVAIYGERKIAAFIQSRFGPMDVGPKGIFQTLADLLKMIQKEDICLLISNSGEASEFYDILNFIKKYSIQMAAISSNPESTLMKAASFKLSIPQSEEVCPIGLAPTTSAILTLAISDAIAVSLMEQRKFSKSDYSFFHPGGKLGTQLLRTKDLMHTGEQIPIVARDDLMEDVLLEMTSKSFGVAIVCKEKKLLEL